MNALAEKTDGLTRALTPLVRALLLEEVRRHADADRRTRAAEIDAEINAACRAVASAADRLAAARFNGAAEANAHRGLVKAAMALGKVMRKHGRMPEGA